MEKNAMDIRRGLIEMPLNSITYLEVEDREAAELQLAHIKLSALDNLFKSYIREFGKPDESNIKWQEIVKEYTEIHANYLSAIYFQISEKLGQDIVVLLSEPCWQLGYDSIKQSIYLYKTCPRAV